MKPLVLAILISLAFPSERLSKFWTVPRTSFIPRDQTLSLSPREDLLRKTRDLERAIELLAREQGRIKQERRLK